jgi:hypothetical protein
MQEFKAYPASRPDGPRMRSTILALFAVVMASYAAPCYSQPKPGPILKQTKASLVWPGFSVFGRAA